MRHTKPCPICGYALVYLGKNRYTCPNPKCSVKLVSESSLGRLRVKEAT